MTSTGSSRADTPGTAATGAGETTPGSDACGDTELTTAVTRLPGAAGSNYALIVFTNKGAGACTIAGYPAVELLDSSKHALGMAATQSGDPSVVITLAGHGSASTLVKDESSVCQADVRSSFVRVTPPGGHTAVVAALVLPPCALTVEPVVAGTNPTPD